VRTARGRTHRTHTRGDTHTHTAHGRLEVQRQAGKGGAGWMPVKRNAEGVWVRFGSRFDWNVSIAAIVIYILEVHATWKVVELVVVVVLRREEGAV